MGNLTIRVRASICLFLAIASPFVVHGCRPEDATRGLQSGLVNGDGVDSPASAENGSAVTEERFQPWIARIDLDPALELSEKVWRAFMTFDLHEDPTAVDLGLEILEAYPDHPEFQRLRRRCAELLLANNQATRAIELLKTVAEIPVDDWLEAQFMLGDAYRVDHNTEQALLVFAKLGVVAPDELRRLKARFLGAVTRLYGGQERAGLEELRQLASEIEKLNKPELQPIGSAASIQIEIASQWALPR